MDAPHSCIVSLLSHVPLGIINEDSSLLPVLEMLDPATTTVHRNVSRMYLVLLASLRLAIVFQVSEASNYGLQV